MSTIAVPLSDSMRRAALASAARHGVTLEQFAEEAIGRALAADANELQLRERFSRASREKFDAVLAKVPDMPPQPGDELPG